MNKFVLVVGLFALVVSCRPQVVNQSAVFGPARIPAGYLLEKNICDINSESTQFNPTVFNYNGQKEKVEKLLLKDVSLNSGTLSGKNVKSVKYGSHQQQQCQSEGVCSNTVFQISPGEDVEICAEQEYDRESVQGIAITALSFVERSFDFASKNDFLDNATQAIMHILPSVEEKIGDKSKIRSDNMATIFSKFSLPIISIYGKSLESIANGFLEGVNLWESQWAIAHEVGHIIFNTHSRYAQKYLKDEAALISWHSTQKVMQSNLSGSTQKEDIGIAAEAFSDLWGYYSTGAKPDTLNGMDCLELSRDISHKTFADDTTTKVLDSAKIAEFLSDVKLPSSSCEKPSFQNIHTMGAVVSYSLDRLYSSSSNRVEDKLVLLKTWIKSLSHEIENADSSLENVLLRAIVPLMLEEKTLTNKQCQIVREQFPVYANKWFRNGLKCKG